MFVLWLVAWLLPATGLRAQVTLVSGGKSEAEIVVGDDPPMSVSLAAQELSQFLHRASGASFPVKARSQAPVQIHLGNTPEAAATLPPPLPDEHLVAVCPKGRIFLRGEDSPVKGAMDYGRLLLWVEKKGTLETVYTFLEKRLGVRFLEPGPNGTHVPACDKLVLPEGKEVFFPAFKERRTFYLRVPSNCRDLQEYGSMNDFRLWGLRLRYTSLVVPVQGCHSFAYLNLKASFFEKHPEWFALQADGSRSPHDFCWSHPEVEQLWFQMADCYFRGLPPRTVGVERDQWPECSTRKDEFMIDPHDYLSYFCQCPQCRAYREKHGERGQGNLIFKVIFKVARHIQEAHPGKHISTLIYPPKRFFPADMDIPSNVRVRLTWPWLAIEPQTADYRTVESLARQWQALVPDKKIYLWNYLISAFGNQLYGIPEITPHRFQRFLKQVRSFAEGIFYEHIQPSHTVRNLDMYMIAHLLWSPELDLDQALKEYWACYAGPAAPTMQTFYDQLERKWSDIYHYLASKGEQGNGRPMITHLQYIFKHYYTYDDILRLQRLLEQAEKEASAKPLFLRRIDRYKRLVLDSLKKEFSIHAVDQSRTFKHETIICCLDLEMPPQERDWQQAPWLTLRSVHPNAKPSVQSRFKIISTPTHLFLKAEFQEPLLDQSRTRDHGKKTDREIFQDIWLDNEMELFAHGGNGPIAQLVINDRGCAGLHKVGEKSFTTRLPGADIRVERQKAAWTVQAAIPLSLLGLGGGARMERLNLTRTRNVGTLAREHMTWSEDCLLNRWTTPRCYGRMARIKPVRREPGPVYSGQVRRPQGRVVRTLFTSEQTRHRSYWWSWVTSPGKARPLVDISQGFRHPGSHCLDYSYDDPQGKDYVSSWTCRLPLSAGLKGKWIRASARIRVSTSNPNACVSLSADWNGRDMLWYRKSARPLSGAVTKASVNDQWQQLELDIPVPDEAEIAYMSFSLRGAQIMPGKIWMDDLNVSLLAP